MPCIELIKGSLELVHLSSEADYRQQHAEVVTGRFLHPVSLETRAALDGLYAELCPQSSDRVRLSVFGRSVSIAAGALGTAARFTFADLFSGNQSAADFIEIVCNFPCVFVYEIPVLDGSMRNELRRIIVFVDQAYEHNVRGAR